MIARAAFIVPGFSHKTSETPYKRIADRFAARGIEPVAIDVRWRMQTIPGYVRFVRDRIAETPARESYFLGFSLGAMCLLNAAPSVRPSAQVLCSLMPLYAEDQPHHAWWMRAWAWRVYLGRRKVRYPDGDLDGTRTIFVYGEREHRIIQPGVRAARAERFPGSETVVVPGAKHAIAETAYLDAALAIIDEL